MCSRDDCFYTSIYIYYIYSVSQKRAGYIEITSENIKDFQKTQNMFQDDIKLLELLKQYKKVIYNCHCPLEWLPDEVVRIEVRETYDIDKIDGYVCIFGEECNYLGDIELLEQIKKYKKLLYCNKEPINWLPEGITHLEIHNNDFNHPLENLPASLIYLGICGRKMVYSESDFNQSLDYLPVGLKCLQLNSLCNEIPLNNLPPGLEYLFIVQREYSLPLDNLPDGVKIKVILAYDNSGDNSGIMFEQTMIPEEFRMVRL